MCLNKSRRDGTLGLLIHPSSYVTHPHRCKIPTLPTGVSSLGNQKMVAKLEWETKSTSQWKAMYIFRKQHIQEPYFSLTFFSTRPITTNRLKKKKKCQCSLGTLLWGIKKYNSIFMDFRLIHSSIKDTLFSPPVSFNHSFCISCSKSSSTTLCQ